MLAEVRDGAQGAAGPAELQVVDIEVQYGQVTALRPTTFTVRPGTVLAVLGPNGAGKTSLANALSGLIHAKATSIRLDGTEVAGLPAYSRVRLGIGHLPDTRGIFPSLSVAENLKMGFHREGRARTSDMAAAYEQFPSLARRKRVAAGHLSGGEQQMLAFARLLVAPPRLLIVDELSHGLAPGIVAELFESLEQLKGRCSVLMIEQYVTRAVNLADDVMVLAHGTLTHFGPSSSFSVDQAAALYSLREDSDGNE